MKPTISLRQDMDYRLLLLLSRVGEALSKLREVELGQYTISPTEAFAMFCLQEIGSEATPAELSRKMRRRHNTVTALLRRMERKGLLTRWKKDVGKRNTWRVVLTEKGETVRHQAMILASVHEAFSCISLDQKLELESNLRTVNDNAQAQLASARGD